MPYYGGKRGYGKGQWIAGLLPWEKHSCYIEPFAGMAGVLLARPPVKLEMLNDMNGRVVNWWRIARNFPDEFGRLVEHTPRNRDEYRWACAAVDDPDLPDIQRALAFHIVISQCITAGDNRLNGGSWNRHFNPAVGSISRRSAGDIVRLAKSMRDVQLENSDALGLLERMADGDYAVIYCDPPYPTANTEGYAIGDFDFDRLADLLRLQKGRLRSAAILGNGIAWDGRPSGNRHYGGKFPGAAKPEPRCCGAMPGA